MCHRSHLDHVIDAAGFQFLIIVSSFLVKYCDSVLKRLPDARTLISLRQRLLQRREDEEGGVRESENDGTSDLCLEERIKNAG